MITKHHLMLLAIGAAAGYFLSTTVKDYPGFSHAYAFGYSF